MRLISDDRLKERASDAERFYQCLTCAYIESCNLDEKSEDGRVRNTVLIKFYKRRINALNVRLLQIMLKL